MQLGVLVLRLIEPECVNPGNLSWAEQKKCCEVDIFRHLNTSHMFHLRIQRRRSSNGIIADGINYAQSWMVMSLPVKLIGNYWSFNDY